MDPVFKWSKFATKQEQLLSIIHGLTSGIMDKRKLDYEERGEEAYPEELRHGKAIDEKTEAKIKSSTMRYVRDDLDEIDENDVGE